jgi:hypothetical protein
MLQTSYVCRSQNHEAMTKPFLKICLALMLVLSGVMAQAQIGVFPQLPLNDTFANRCVISPSWPQATNWIYGSLSNATIEANEPYLDGISSGQTVWGSWTAPSNGIVTLSVDAETFRPLLTVYAGSAAAPTSNPLGAFPGSIATVASDFSDLSLVASNNYLICYQDPPCGYHWRERNQISFHVARGTNYQICVDSAIITDASWGEQAFTITGFDSKPFTSYGWGITQMTNTFAGGDVILGLQFTPAPKNDDFANRLRLSGSRTSIKTSNAGATKEINEPDHLGNPGGSSIWYSWTAPASGRVSLSTNEIAAYAPPSSTSGGGSYGSVTTIINPGPPDCGAEIDQNPPPIFYPVFAAYTGNAVGALTSANCLPMSLDAFPNAVEFDVVKGQTYQIAFDGNMGTTGALPLYLALTQPAANNNFANRVQLHGIYATATSYNAGATHQTGEPMLANSTGKTVWWSWTAPVGGTVSIDLGGSDFAFPVGIFTGTSVNKLQLIAQDAGGVSFTAVAGQTYQIGVSDLGGLTGAIALKLEATVVELPLVSGLRKTPTSELLIYSIQPEQVILLQSSVDGLNWKNVPQQNLLTLKPSSRTIQFFVPLMSKGKPLSYRAMVVDILSGNYFR